MNNRDKRKQARLWFLVSRLNLEYINEYYRQRGSKEYQPLLGNRHTPEYVLNSRLLKYLFICMTSIMLIVRLIKNSVAAIIEKNRVESSEFRGNSVYVLSGKTSTLPRLLAHANIDTTNGYWLCPRTYFPQNLPKDRLVYSLSLLSYSHIFGTICDAIRLYFYLCFKKGFAYSLEVNGCFDWLLNYWTLQSINADAVLYFAQQYDPSIIYIDKAPQKRKIHVQHGTMILKHNLFGIKYPIMQYIEKYDCWTMNSPYKMSSVEMVYAFTEAEFTAECKSIFKNIPFSSIVGYNLRRENLMEVNRAKKSVLIVGFYKAYSDIEESLIQSLQKLDVDIYLKNHPTDLVEWYDEMKMKYEFDLLDGNSFPKTDIVLSYDSTLALEYEALGIDVIYYHVEPINSVIERVKQILLLS